MRIRSIKPEFWRDESIVDMEITARLTFIGLWSYVDDNGVGDARLSSIVADLYAHDLSCKPQETLRRVSGDLQQLKNAGLIVTYTDPTQARRELLYIRNWTKHQIVNRPSKGNSYPLPSAETIEESDTHAVCMSVSGDTLDTLRAGAGEQGSRGAGDKPPTPLGTQVQTAHAGGDTKAVARMKTLNELSIGAPAIEVAKHYTAWAGGGIDSKTRHEIAREVDPLLNDGIDPRQVAEGIKAWHASDSWSPTQIRRFVAKAARPSQPDQKPTKATLRAVDTMTAAEQIIAAMEIA